ncbi:polyphosphate kinase 1 [Paenibacillus cremeus]|uniref:Polyphosphate kinase n=1 Tax=Paenibacillus cremeus TaxID=2163881 RepID=A0A559KE89_9BACL|nr:polyphosphate kinase 1 [Paenibacillus cremeus]TVY10434.1 polyphosphate kinase 1 [Paenibacillus cremeus]
MIYSNRDLSWLKFNHRVLEEAMDENTPLLERVKFLSIVATNLDEFMSIRVPRVIDQINSKVFQKDFAGYTPEGLLKRITRRAKTLVELQYRTFHTVFHELKQHGIQCKAMDELDHMQKKELQSYYTNKVFPVLTPMAIDQSRPFPLFRSKGLYLSVVLRQEGIATEEDDEPDLAFLQVPANLPRIIPVPSNSKNSQEFILLEDLIKDQIDTLFFGYTLIGVHCFRITRNADFILEEEEAEDLVEEMQKEIRRRQWGNPVRLEIEKDFHPFALKALREELELCDIVYEIGGPLDLSYLMKLPEMIPGMYQLRYPRVEPIYPMDMDRSDIFAMLKQRDMLAFHPYESFEVVPDFLQQAAIDPSVLAIKMTLYRVSGDSPLVHALERAAELGKQVTVLVEIKARFDEERNIAWARKLERAGCHIVYGLVGLKTHAKLIMVVREESGTLQRYVHISTGNYNEHTARLFTDIGLFTSNAKIGEDIAVLFNEMTGFSTARDWNYISAAPTDLKQTLITKIQREMKHCQEGKPARIIAKMNSLSNREMVDQLYAASQAGIKIDLIVRGICVLRPGIPGISENITVRSIIDRYLEHSRIFYFENAGDPEVWLSSADWMSRNLERRIELICPVLDQSLKDLVIQSLQLVLSDRVKSRIMLPSGRYVRENGGASPIRSQFETQEFIAAWKKHRYQTIPSH